MKTNEKRPKQGDELFVLSRLHGESGEFQRARLKAGDAVKVRTDKGVIDGVVNNAYFSWLYVKAGRVQYYFACAQGEQYMESRGGGSYIDYDTLDWKQEKMAGE